MNLTYDATNERIFIEDRNVMAEREYYWEWLFFKEVCRLLYILYTASYLDAVHQSAIPSYISTNI